MAINVILEYGEFGYDSTTKTAKIGDGSSTWEQLDTFNKTPLVNDLVSHRTDAALTAYQGNVLSHDKINYLDIVDSLDGTTLANNTSTTSYTVTKVLSANMGKALHQAIQNVRSDLTGAIQSGDRDIESQISSTLSSFSSALSSKYDNDITDIKSDVTTLKGQITSLATNATDPASTEVRAARVDTYGITHDSLSENILDIDYRTKHGINANYDLMASGLVIKHVLNFIHKEILDAKAGDAEAIRAIKIINDEFTHNTCSELDSIYADIQSTALALKENFIDIERNLMITMYDKYILSRVAKQNEQDLLRVEFDNFLSAQVLKKLIEEMDRNLSLERFDNELFAHCMNVFVKSTQLFEKDITKKVDLLTDGAITSTGEITNIKNNISNLSPRVSTLETTLTNFKEDYDNEIKNNDRNTLGTNSDLTSLALIIKELVNDIDHKQDLVNIDNNASALAINRKIDEIDSHRVAIDNILNNTVIPTLSGDINPRVTTLESNLSNLTNNYTNHINNYNEEVSNNDRNTLGVNIDTSTATLAIKKTIEDIDDINVLVNLDNNVSSLAINRKFDSIDTKIWDIDHKQDLVNIDTNSSALAINKKFNDIDHKQELINVDNNTSALAISKKLDEGYIRELDKFVNIDLQQTMEILKYHITQSEKRSNDLEKALEGGVNVNNLSAESSIHINIPRCAVVNITGTNSMPTSKTVDTNATMEFWDMSGNYFKKKIIMSAQGSSSMGYVKKNFKFDLCNDEWLGDDTFTIKFGNWVPQDSYHCKAFYTDAFRGIGIVSYTLYNDIVKTRGIEKDRPWKKELIDYSKINTTTRGFQSELSDLKLQYDTGARNVPDGFPVVLYLNSEFYGIFTWQLKKHRDNYHQNKSTLTHIQLDGVLNQSTIWDGYVNWTQFEIRNPKDLYTMDGKKYNGDYPLELIDSTSEYFNLSSDSAKVNTNKQNTAIVKQYIIDFSNHMGDILRAKSIYDTNKTKENLEALKEVFETYFDVENQIDYLIFSDIIKNSDGFSKNWQWVTYDGIKWYVNPYDCDMSFGGYFQGNQITPVLTNHINSNTHYPCYYIINYYKTELEERYKELRNHNVISVDHIMSILEDWTSRIGEDNYEREFKRWSNSPCNGDNVVNTEYWILRQNSDKTPEMANSSTYSALVEYQPGDIVSYGLNSTMGFYNFGCIKNAEGIPPIREFRHRDNIYRVKKWITKNIENMDRLYNYDFYAYSLTRLSQTVEEIENKDYKEISKISADLTDAINSLKKVISNLDKAKMDKE